MLVGGNNGAIYLVPVGGNRKVTGDEFMVFVVMILPIRQHVIELAVMIAKLIKYK